MIDLSLNVWKKSLQISLALFMVSVCIGNYPANVAFKKNAFASDNKPQGDNIIEDSVSTSSDIHKIDPKADSLLKEMSDFLGTKYKYSFKAEIMFDDIIDSGRKLQRSASEKVFVQKTNKVYIEYISDVGGQKFWYDDSNVTILDLPRSLYSKIVVPTSIDQAFDELLKRYDYSTPFSELLFVNPYKILTENVEAGYYIGSSIVFGVPCNHLGLVDRNVDWQIWIEDGQRKIPRKLVITYKKIPGSPQFIAILKDWIFDQPFSHFLFKPDIPKYARETEMSKTPNNLESDLGSIRGSVRNSQTD
ncbi:MAG TPA: DUF2092 domain-containing protein [Thermodesulfobacteriota bacterium]